MVHDISHEDIKRLLRLAEIEDHWAENIQQQVNARYEALDKPEDFNPPSSDWIVEALLFESLC